jgi:hypothetical protein
MRASLKGRVSTRHECTRHRVHSTTKTTKRSRESETPAPTTDSLDLSNYCPSDLILKWIYLRRTATTDTRAAAAAPDSAPDSAPP